MVKVSTVRSNRLYGPPQSRQRFEMSNAVSYLIATLLLLLGVILQLPGLNNILGLALLLLALLLFIAINLHDFHAHLAGIEFQLDRLRYDKQLTLVELGASLLYATGSALILVALLFLLRITHGTYYSLDVHSALRLLSTRLMLVGTAIWLLASILNNFQVYQRTPLQLQAYNKSVLLFMLVATALFYLSALVGLETWPRRSLAQVVGVAVWLSVVAAALLVLAAVVNLVKVIQMHQMEGAGALLEPFRGQLVEASNVATPLLRDDGVSPAEQIIGAEEVSYATTTTAVEPERLY